MLSNSKQYITDIIAASQDGNLKTRNNSQCDFTDFILNRIEANTTGYNGNYVVDAATLYEDFNYMIDQLKKAANAIQCEAELCKLLKD